MNVRKMLLKEDGSGGSGTSTEGGEPEWAKKLAAKLDSLSQQLQKTETPPSASKPQEVPAPAKPNPEQPPASTTSGSTPQEKPEPKAEKKKGFLDWLIG